MRRILALALLLLAVASTEGSMWGSEEETVKVEEDFSSKKKNKSSFRDPKTVERKLKKKKSFAGDEDDNNDEEDEEDRSLQEKKGSSNLFSTSSSFSSKSNNEDEEEEEEDPNARTLKRFHMFGSTKKDPSENFDFTTLRYLTFGTSRTWGSGLDDRFKEAYPYLMSPDVTNLAKRATGPAYPALCTQSLVGTRLYDVIVLEYYMDNANKIIKLAQRLRGRFPDALILFVKLWLPSRYRNKTAPRGKKSMKNWAKANGYDDHNSKEFKKFLTSETGPDDWDLLEKPDYGENVRAAADAVGGHMINLPNPINAHDAILSYGQYFLPDMIHFSPIGHDYIKQAIENAIKESQFFKRQNKVNPWAERDECDDWHESGKTKEYHSEELQMIEYSNGKFALEVPPSGGYIQLLNPMQHEAHVYLNFLTTGPDKKYPKATLALKRKANFPHVMGQPVEVDPWNPDAQSDVHITDMVRVGTVPARGRPVLVILPEEGESDWPFRITGVAVAKPEGEEEEVDEGNSVVKLVGNKADYDSNDDKKNSGINDVEKSNDDGEEVTVDDNGDEPKLSKKKKKKKKGGDDDGEEVSVSEKRKLLRA